MALENDDLLVVQKSGGGELRKVKISDIKTDELWTEDAGKLYPTTLANNVQVGGTAADPNISLSDNGRIDIYRPTETANNTALRIRSDVGTPDSVKAEILADGSTTIAGAVNVPQSIADGDAVNINPNGNVAIRRDDTASSAFQISKGAGNNNRTIRMLSDGSAEFAGTIQVAGDPNSGGAAGNSIDASGGIKAARTSGTQATFRGYLVGTATPTITIKADGSADFAGNIQTGDFDAVDTNVRGARIDNVGTLNVQRRASDAVTQNIASYQGTDRRFVVLTRGDVKIGGTGADASNPTILLNANGSSQYSGTGRFGTTNAGVLIGPNDVGTAEERGRIQIDVPSAASASAKAFAINKGGTQVSGFDTDGALKIGGTLPSAPNITLNANGSGIFTRRIDVANSTTNQDEVVFAINTGASLSTTQRSKADGSLQIGNINGPADTANITLNANGKGTFNGGLLAYKSGGVALAVKRQATVANAVPAIEVSASDQDDVVVINTDGSASFESSVIVKRTGDGTSPAEVGLCYGSGSFPAIGAGQLGITVKEQGAASDNGIFLGANGNAFYSGKVNVGDLSNQSGCRIYNTGSFYARYDGSDSFYPVFKAYKGGFSDATQTIQIQATGQIDIGGVFPSAPNISLNPNGKITAKSFDLESLQELS